MKIIYRISIIACAFAVSSCFDERRPNYQYMPNMYEAVPYETYSESPAFNRGGTEAQLPAPGSINRGFVPYDLDNTTADYEMSKTRGSSLDSLEYDEPKAQQLYTIYCAICHGDKGDGKGKLVQKEKYLGVPSYKDRQITTGSVFHVETYGLNAMGSYKNQLTAQERWQVAEYVMKLRSEL